MLSKRIYGLVGVVVLSVLVGCGQPSERLNAPPQGHAEHQNEMQAFFTSMTDNAALLDMSVSDAHFIPGTAELNSLGETKLDRIVEVTDQRGGQVCYSARITDEQLIEDRLAAVRSYLHEGGLDLDKVTVRVGMSASQRTSAERALEQQEKAKKAKAAQPTQMMAPMSPR